MLNGKAYFADNPYQLLDLSTYQPHLIQYNYEDDQQSGPFIVSSWYGIAVSLQ